MEKKRAELKRLNGVYGGIMEKAAVEVIEGRATIVDPHTVEVNGKRYTTKYICVAVGGTPNLLDLPGTVPASALAYQYQRCQSTCEP
jgi:glutathione reductase (NADPH)